MCYEFDSVLILKRILQETNLPPENTIEKETERAFDQTS